MVARGKCVAPLANAVAGRARVVAAIGDVVALRLNCETAGAEGVAAVAGSDGEQQAFDFLEPPLGVLFREARELAAKRDEIVVARDL